MARNIGQWAVTKEDAWKISALNQWCLQRLLGIKWYQFVSNAEVRRMTSHWQSVTSHLNYPIQASLPCQHIAQMDDDIDATPLSWLPLLFNIEPPAL